jgi:outer membrane receptor protein involved in Fe transport
VPGLLKLFCCGVLLWVSFSPALADTGDSDELLDEFAFLQEEEIVLTAAKHKQRVGFSPSAVIVITRKDIDESGATTLTELLRRYPATHVYMYDPFIIQTQVRGTTRVLLVLDGREVNLEIFPQPFFSLVPIGLLHIERVEIVMGPNSALYGANAVSAVINIVTRQPADDLTADLRIAAGQHGTTVIEGLVSGGAGPVILQGTLGIDRANSWMRRAFSRKDLIRATLTARLNLGDARLTANAGVVDGGGLIFSTIGYMDFHRLTLPHAKVEFELGDLKSRVYWYGVRTSFDLDVPLIHPDTGVSLGSMPTFDLDGDTFQADAQYDLELFEGNLLIAGADFRYTSFRSDQMVDPDIYQYRIGVFLHDEQWIGQRLLLTLGARFDYNSLTDPAVSPRAAVVYNPAGEHFLRVSAGMAFRKPTMAETSANFIINENPAFPEIGRLFEEKGLSNPDLPNEILIAVELGYRAALLDKALRLGADAYFGMNRNYIGFETDIRFNQFGQIDFENSHMSFGDFGGDANIVGGSLSIEGEPVEALTLFLRGEFRHMWEVKDNSRYTFTLRSLGSAGGVLRLPMGLTIHLALVYIGEREDETNDPTSALAPVLVFQLPAYTYLLGALSYSLKLGESHLDLGLTLFNPFGGRFRGESGLTAPDGTNYGGEVVGTRAMITARFRL